VRRNTRRREDPLATLLLTLARTDYFVVQALHEAIERDQLKILTAMIQTRTRLQLPYFSDGHTRKAHASPLRRSNAARFRNPEAKSAGQQAQYSSIRTCGPSGRTVSVITLVQPKRVMNKYLNQ
jgi:hypothetical protein